MNKFIEVHWTVINITDIRRIEFISDDIYLGLLPKGDNGEIICDYINFDFAKIYTFDGQVINLYIHLYAPEDGETEEEWRKRNMAYISMTMTDIYEVINPINVTNKEYNNY